MSVLTTQNVQARVPFGTKYYFSSNLEKAFSAVEVVEDSRLFLTYPALKEWYHCKRMPFGPMNAPAYFTQLMQQVLDHNYSDCAIHHVDDLLGFAPHFLG